MCLKPTHSDTENVIAKKSEMSPEKNSRAAETGKLEKTPFEI